MTYDMAFSLNGKVPPQAVELEETVLGALMLDENALSNTIEILRSEFFYKIEHQLIFKAIHSLFEKSKQIDIMTVIQELSHSGHLEEVGGAYYVSQLTNKVVSAAHVEYHARILSEKYMQRELIRTSTETIKEAYDETNDVLDLLDRAEQNLMDINDKNFHSDYHKMEDVVAKAYEQIKNAQENDSSVAGVPTGFMELDRMTAGFHPGTLLILAARPAMGKTAFALSMARNMAVQFNMPIAFFSLEMTAVELVMRLISSEAEIPGDTLKKGLKMPGWQEEQLKTKIEALKDAPLFIDDTPQLSIFELRAKCRRLHQRHKIKMIFIDYLQLMQAGGESSKNGNREQEISMISRQLKSLSKELEVPVLALSQLSREVEKRGGTKKPQLSDLRESGAIEQDADIVMFIYRPEYYDITEDDKGSTLGMADIILAKHRSGATGECRLKFIKQFARFDNRDVVDTEGLGSGAGGFAANENFDQGSPMNGGTMIVDSRMNMEDQENENMF